MQSTGKRFVVSVLLAALIGFVPCRSASAQSIEIVHAFQTLPANPVGELLEVAPNVYLGASRTGGAFYLGSVYALFRNADGTWATFVVHSFSRSDGTPTSGVMRASNGSFYGTTRNGGSAAGGSVYRITPAGVFTTLHSFTMAEGLYPLAALTEGPDGLLWGSTTRDGPSGYGSIFKMTPLGAVTIVRALNTTTGSGMLSPFVRGGDGRLYGVHPFGGTAGFGGVVFRITTAGALTVLRNFSSNEYGDKWIRAGIDGNIYGVTTQGGMVSVGLLFRVTLLGTVTDIKSFVPEQPGDMWNPRGAPIQRPDGMFYGVALSNGLPNPTFTGGVYRLTLTGQAREIATFGGSFGVFASGLTVASDGSFVGTTELGERPTPLELNYGLGVAFSVQPAGSLTQLYPFAQSTSPHPVGRLIEGPDGRLYGTTCVGGLYNRGTVFRLDSPGPTTLHSFSAGDDGACPMGGVTFGADGAIVGTTAFALPQPHGRIFRIAPDSTFSVLWRPPSEGWRYLLAAPSVGPDGALYATASGFAGGEPGGGVLRIGADGAVTEFANMNQSPNWFPGSPLALANDGNMYGTTLEQEGGLYRVASDGTVSSGPLFPAPRPTFRSGVVQGADGRLYGSLQTGGASGLGSVYASTLDGTVSVLHEFQGSDGLAPWGELLEVSSGRFLGVTSGGGPAGFDPFGSIYEVAADGSFSTVHSFSETDGATPFGALIRASDGTIYGTTQRGGPLGGGVIFRIVPK